MALHLRHDAHPALSRRRGLPTEAITFDGPEGTTLQAARAKAGLTHELVDLPRGGARLLQRHRAAVRRGAAAQAYERVLDWFGRHLA